MRFRQTLFFVVAGALAASAGAADATDDASSGAPAPAASPSASPAPPERYNAHAQITNAQQYAGRFHAAYSGANSLTNLPDTQKTVEADLFVGARIWDGGAVYVAPELDQGFGLGNYGPPGTPFNGTVGLGGFSSGLAYKVGRNSSYGRLQRAFVRQTFDLGGARQTVASAMDQLAGSQSTDHLVVTAGKFAVTDVFDDNVYAHDPTNDFLNWSLIDDGAFDYAADSYGFTYGISGELAGANQTLRIGLFQLSATPNDVEIEHQPLLQYMPVIEYERVTSFFGGRPGSYKALLYGDDGYLGGYATAVDVARAAGTIPSTAAVRARVFKTGAGLNLAQEVAPHVGVFARLSAMNGTFEADDFTEIDRSAAGGISIDGGLYRRPNDTFGLAAVANGLSLPAREYFAAGGLGILIGDGALSYDGEDITEAYYRFGLATGVGITADFQRITNPAYNAARGPVSIFSLRYHAQI